MTSDDRFSWDYKPPAQRLEPVTLDPPLWTLTKGTHSASAHVKAIDGIGLELRFSIDGELYYSHRFTAWEPLEQAAREKARRFRGEGVDGVNSNE